MIWQPSADGHHWIGHMILKKAVLDGSGKPSDSSVLGNVKTERLFLKIFSLFIINYNYVQ